MIVTGERAAEVAQWMVERVKHLEVPQLYTTIALIDDGEIRAAVMYESFVHPFIEAHIAGERLTSYFLAEALRYPFEQLGCSRITVRVASDNLRSQRFVTKLGFTLEGRLRETLPGPLDVLVFGMLRRECRWLGVKPHGNQFDAAGRSDAAAAATGARRSAVRRAGMDG